MRDDENPAAVEMPDSEPSRGLSPFVKVALVFGLLGGALALLLFGSDASDALVYSKLVDEVLTDPAQFHGRELRVEGDLQQGSIKFKESPCEWRFTLTAKEREMPVHFDQCIVPDTFKDGMGLKVTVQGQLMPDGHFEANQVIPRCPSKYEMKQLEASGQKRPYGMEQGGPPAI